MLRIDFLILEDEPVDFSHLSDAELSMTLRYDAFCGDIVIAQGAQNIKAQWGWIPIVDFAGSLACVAKNLDSLTRHVVDFTENDSAIIIEKSGNVINIRADFSDEEIITERLTFLSAVEDFLGRVRDQVGKRSKHVINNAILSAILSCAEISQESNSQPSATARFLQ